MSVPHEIRNELGPSAGFETLSLIQIGYDSSVIMILEWFM